MRKKTQEEFARKIQDKFGDDYVVVGEYINWKTPVDVMHKPCGRVIPISPDCLNKPHGGCVECNRRDRGRQIFEQHLVEKYGDEYSLVGDYVNNTTYVQLRHNSCGHVDEIQPVHLPDWKGCTSCRPKQVHPTMAYDDLLLQRQLALHCKVPYLDIISMDDSGNKPKITVRCKKCNGVATRRYDYLMDKAKCPCCETLNRADKEKYTLANIRPDIAALLKNPEKAHIYSPASMKHEDFICPKCGSVVNTSVRQVCRKGLYCHRCEKTNSYPNRLMFAILQSLNINFEDEYSPEFIQPMRYDFYFTIGKQRVIVEMDGGFHNKGNKLRGLSLDEVREIDNYKTMMAIQNNIDIIRIDCDYKHVDLRYEFIKNNILTSRLLQYIDVDSVDFDKCNRIAITPEIELVCQQWNDGVHDVAKLRKLFHITQTTLLKYLRLGEEIGICTYKHVEYRDMVNKQNGQRMREFSRKPVLCINTNEIFSSGRRAEQKYGGDLSSYFAGKKSYSGKHPETGEHLHWNRLTVDEETILKTNAEYVFVS